MRKVKNLFLALLASFSFLAAAQAPGQIVSGAKRIDLGATPLSGSTSATGVGFDCDLFTEDCTYTVECEDCNLKIFTNSFSILSYDGLTEVFGCGANTSCGPLVAWRMPTGVPLSADVNQITTSATASGTFNECISGAGNVTVTLPVDGLSNSREVWIYDRSGESNTCTIAAPSGQKLDGTLNGTVTMSDGEVRRLLQVTAAGEWRTMAVYPNPHSVTTGAIPYANSSTTFAASEQTRVAQDSYRQVRGTNAQTAEWCMTYTNSSNYACLRYSSSGGVQELKSQAAGTTAHFRIGTSANNLRLSPMGVDVFGVSTGGLSVYTSDTYDVGATSGYIRYLFVTRGIVGSKSKALVESTATSFLRVAVPTSESRSVHIKYVVRANDATDFQAISGSIVATVSNKAGTLSLSTPVDTQDTCACSAGTLTAAATIVDAGSGNLEIKMNAASSLAQTTLAIDYFPVLPLPATLTNL